MNEAENTAIAVAEPQETTVSSRPSLDKGDFTVEYEEFSRGLTKGFGFYYKQYKEVDKAIAHLDSLNKDSKTNGEQIVLALLNSAIKNANRGKANSRLPVQDEADKDGSLRKAAIESLRVNGKTTLIDETEAEQYVPGTREKTSIPALWKEYNNLKDEYQKLKAAGHLEDAEATKAEAKEVKAKIDALLAAEDELDSL